MTTLPRHFVPDASPVLPHAGRIGLRVFMAVVTALFSLLILGVGTAITLYQGGVVPVQHLSLSSVVSKVIMPGVIVPVGIVTALVGVPIFVVLVFKRGRQL